MADRAPRPPATERTVREEDWSARDLGDARHERTLFADVDMTEVASRGAAFTECVFRRVKLNASTHVDSAFVNCTFANCSFFGARLTECKLVGSAFDRCTYDTLQVAGGNWAHVALRGADLRSAYFRGVRLREADLANARLDGASLRDGDLAGVYLRGASLVRCDLRGSDLTGIEPGEMELAGAIVTPEQAVIIAMALGLDVRVE